MRNGLKIPHIHQSLHHNHPGHTHHRDYLWFETGISTILSLFKCYCITQTKGLHISDTSSTPIIYNYAHIFHHHDERNTLSPLTLRILSFYDDNTRYTVARTLAQLVLQIQICLDRVGNLYLVTKLGRKHKTYNVSIANSDTTDILPIFTSTAWIYDHEALIPTNRSTSLIT